MKRNTISPVLQPRPHPFFEGKALGTRLPRTPLRLKSNAAPRFVSLTVFYRALKHEHVTDFSGLDRLLSL